MLDTHTHTYTHTQTHRQTHDLAECTLDRALQVLAFELYRRIQNLHPIDLDPVKNVVRKRGQVTVVDNKVGQMVSPESSKSLDERRRMLDPPAGGNGLDLSVVIIFMLQDEIDVGFQCNSPLVMIHTQ